MTVEQFNKAIEDACYKAAKEQGENLDNLGCLFKNWKHKFSKNK